MSMTDAFEADLRSRLADFAQDLPAEDVIHRLEQIDYHPQKHRRLVPVRLRWPAIGAATAATGSVLATGVLLLTSGATPAYAGWSPAPTAVVTPTALAAATASCNRSHASGAGPLLSGTPALTDARGRYTAAIYVVGSKVYECLSDGHSDGSTTLGMSAMLLNFYARPSADELGLPANFSSTVASPMGGTGDEQLPPALRRAVRIHGSASVARRARMMASLRQQLASDVERSAFGLAGSDVRAVAFEFADGLTVDATVENGWYFAWWPSSAYPSSVSVTTTTSGSLTSPMMPSAEQGTGCQPGNAGCVWAGGQPGSVGGTTMSSSTATPSGAGSDGATP